ncbi:MAG: GntR family transcriptional regulator [Eubacterium sp.]|nr:GntR family transcriptional regulator [Eubacterium sp.]
MKTYEYILNDLQGKIEQGVYAPEQQLPSLRELAKIYSTTPVTAKKSLSILQERGYVYVLDRHGFFVCSKKNKRYTMIFNETKSIDQLTDIKIVDIKEADEKTVQTYFNPSEAAQVRCLQFTRMLYNGTMPVGIDIKYIIHNSRVSFPVKNPERLMDSMNLVLNNYDIYKSLEITVMTDNTPVRECLFIGPEEGVFKFKQTYRTVKGQIVGVSETYVPCEEINLKMKY